MPEQLQMAGINHEVSTPIGQTVVAQQSGEANPEPPHRMVSLDEGVKAVGDGAKLLNDYGPATIIVSVFLIMFVVSAYLIRHDYLASDKERTVSSKEAVKYVVDAEERKHNATLETFMKMHSDAREDARETASKMWGGMRDVRDSTREQTAAVKELIIEFKKVAQSKP